MSKTNIDTTCSVFLRDARDIKLEWDRVSDTSLSPYDRVRIKIGDAEMAIYPETDAISESLREAFLNLAAPKQDLDPEANPELPELPISHLAAQEWADKNARMAIESGWAELLEQVNFGEEGGK